MKKIVWSLLALTFTADMTYAEGKKPSAPHKRELSVTIDDVVRRVEPDGENYRVVFKKHSAPYVLKKDAPEFNRILMRLSASQGKGEKVRLKADPTSLEIKSLAK